MLTLNYNGDRAIIDDNGHIEYHENHNGAMVVTEAPSQTIVSMVLAVSPFVLTGTVPCLRVELRDAEVALNNAEDMQRAGEEAIGDCTIELHLVSERLKKAEESLQQEKSC